MTDYYQTLGLPPDATADQIKKAYRSLAMKHHPDRGGDQAKFKDISVAYETLSDSQKKAEYDHQRQYGGGPQVKFHTGNFQDFVDIFGQGNPFGNSPFGDIFGQRAGVRRNRDLNIQCQITLTDSFQGKQLEANFTLPSGRQQTVVINVPPGVSNGETIRYPGFGDDSNPSAPRGNLNVTVIVLPDPAFQRVNDDLYTNVFINPIEAIIGCRKKVKPLTGKELEIDIRAGVENGTEYAADGLGFPNPHTGGRGRFVSIVKIRTPVIKDPEIIAQLKKINESIS